MQKSWRGSLGLREVAGDDVSRRMLPLLRCVNMFFGLPIEYISTRLSSALSGQLQHLLQRIPVNSRTGQSPGQIG